MRTIYLSPSQHGTGANRCLKKGCYEDKHTRPMAEAAAKYLEKAGFKVIIAKKNTSMAYRCQESDRVGADLHIPIHTNAAGASARYLMFMAIRTDGEYRDIFEAVAYHMEKIYPGSLEAKFVKRTDLYEINAPKAKTFYCEMGFHTNKTDVNSFIHNPDPIGKALAQGICDYYGVSLEETEGEFKVKVTSSALNIRTGPGTNYDKAGVIKDKGVYTITETDGTWGKLKSEAGWISLNYCKKL